MRFLTAAGVPLIILNRYVPLAVKQDWKPGLKLSLWDGIIPLGESRGGTPSSVRAPKGRAPHRKMRRWYPAFAGVPLRSFYWIDRAKPE
jgi:hypothetical protein